VLATGLIDELSPLKRLRNAWGCDLRICPCFDGNEVRNQRFVVVGLPERLAQLGSWVSMWSSKVSVVTKYHSMRAALSDCVCSELKLCAMKWPGLFTRMTRSSWIATRLKPASDLAASLCDVDGEDFAKADEHGRTSRPGVFAIGNASNPIAHLARAAAAGTVVGPWVTMYLLESLLSHRRGAASTDPHPTILPLSRQPDKDCRRSDNLREPAVGIKQYGNSGIY
jgi:thioredoxin reductase